MKKISIVIPAYNEISNSQYFAKILQEIGSEPTFEIIVVDGGSQDETKEFASTFSSVIVEHIGPSTRAARLNKGIALATAQTILLHHPRVFVAAKDLLLLIENPPNFWGGFTHQFDTKHPILRFTSWYSNKIRGAGWSPASLGRPLLYLDHCIFAPKEYLCTILPLPDVAIFEDTILSQRLHTHFGRGVILPYISEVSAIRFLKSGILRRALLNQIIKLQWYLRIDSNTINTRYQDKTPLNQK